VSGYNLEDLLPERGFHVARSLVGSEGTCAIVLDAKVTLVRSPQHRSLVGLGYADAFEAADHVPEILQFKPIGLEGFEGAMVDGLRTKGAANLELLPQGRGILLVEFGSDEPTGAEHGRTLMASRPASGVGARDAALFSGGDARGLKLRDRVHAPPRTFPARRLAGKGGTTRRSRRRSSGRTCASFARC
jgi:FAD/FMN-containing dehydrogenase